MKIAVYPGSFDPVTVGHMDIIERASQLFDRLVVSVMFNARKKTMFTTMERVALLQKAAAGIPNVEIASSDRLLVDFAGEIGAHVIVKGLRAVSDFELEFQMALINRKMNPALETIFLAAGVSHQYVSSSLVKEIGSLGGCFADFVPSAIYEEVRARIKP